MSKCLWIVLLALAWQGDCNSQELFSWTKETPYCNPSVVGLPRAKALILKYELQPDYRIKSTGKLGNYGSSQGQVNQNRRLDFRLRFPIINKPSLTIAAGIKYTHEEFRFENTPGNNYDLYKDLEDRPLKSLGLHFYVVKPTRTKKYFILRASFDLNGDYTSDKIGKMNFLKFSISPLIGWKQNENLSYAVGVSYGYTFGVPLVIPVLSINKNFNCHFGIESLLPVNLRLRYTPNAKNYLYTGLELAGSSYRLESEGTAFNAYDKLHLFRSELRATINFEREIYDWIWFGIEAGYRNNIFFNLTNGSRSKSDIIIDNHLKAAPLFNASLFAVPPRGLLKKRK